MMEPAGMSEDVDYEVSAEMLIHQDIDDERTLEEEEKMEEEEGRGVEEELIDLQKESELPLEELLASYGYTQFVDPSSVTETSSSVTSTVKPPLLINIANEGSTASKPPPPDLIHVPPEVPTPVRPAFNVPLELTEGVQSSEGVPPPSPPAEAVAMEDKPVSVAGQSSKSPWFRPGADVEALARLRPVPERRSMRMAGVQTTGSSSSSIVDKAFKMWLGSDNSDKDDDSSDDEDYTLSSDWKQCIKIGSDYQAQVPNILLHSPPKDDDRDQLMWDPSRLDESSVSHYLLSVSEIIHAREGLPGTALDRDNEEALRVLADCSYDVTKGLAQYSQEAFTAKGMSPWSEEECRKFETGLRTIGKDFFMLQKQVPTRTVRQIVEFYYLWKKTERCDAFAQQTKTGKKFTLQPGYISDFMEEFLEPPEAEFADLHYGTTTMAAEVKKERSQHTMEDRMRQIPKTVAAKSS